MAQRPDRRRCYGDVTRAARSGRGSASRLTMTAGWRAKPLTRIALCSSFVEVRRGAARRSLRDGWPRLRPRAEPPRLNPRVPKRRGPTTQPVRVPPASRGRALCCVRPWPPSKADSSTADGSGRGTRARSTRALRRLPWPGGTLCRRFYAVSAMAGYTPGTEDPGHAVRGAAVIQVWCPGSCSPACCAGLPGSSPRTRPRR